MRTSADDQFERYFAEKLWEMIPAIYRHEDGIAEQPGVLRSMVEVLAEQAAILRRSQDRLWEDQFIELCSDWAVPYIADLVGARLISALNKRGRRVDVAKTIYYRRRKGTPRILEELISDIAGWEGKVVENFLRLGRARHGLDPHPEPLAGRHSGTMPGGWADLRRPLAAEIAGGPFGEFFHTPDVRRHRGQAGRYNIPKLAVHLYRLTAYPVEEATPYSIGDGQRFTFDPSGRDIPLFNRRNRPDDYNWDEWHSALEWELPTPIRCRLLGHAEYLVSEAVVQKLAADSTISDTAVEALRKISGWKFRDEARLRTTLQSLNVGELLNAEIFTALLRHTIIEACGKQFMLPNVLVVDEDGNIKADDLSIVVKPPDPEEVVTAEYITSADLSEWPDPIEPEYIDRIFGPPGFRKLAIDPENGRLLFREAVTAGDKILVNYHYGFSGNIGAGTYDRRAVEDSEPDRARQGGGALLSINIENNGVTQINDSRTYSPVQNKGEIQNMVLQAANLQRPFLLLKSDWILSANKNKNACLSLDGIWVGAENDNKLLITSDTGEEGGDFECVVLRHCTIDPGRAKVVSSEVSDSEAEDILFPVTLVVGTRIETLIIESSIIGPIRTEGEGFVEKLIIKDSIIQSIDKTIPAIDLANTEVEMNRASIFGAMKVHRLHASEVVITGKVEVTDTQTGCFRFSAAPAESRLPRPYESYLFEKDSEYWFTSRRFGHPGYAQITEVAPLEIQRGAENGSEMGAFSSLLNPIKLDGLKAKIEEYMPFGLIPIFIHET